MLLLLLLLSLLSSLLFIVYCLLILASSIWPFNIAFSYGLLIWPIMDNDTSTGPRGANCRTVSRRPPGPRGCPAAAGRAAPCYDTVIIADVVIVVVIVACLLACLLAGCAACLLAGCAEACWLRCAACWLRCVALLAGCRLQASGVQRAHWPRIAPRPGAMDCPRDALSDYPGLGR